jgi:hypothetical protein
MNFVPVDNVHESSNPVRSAVSPPRGRLYDQVAGIVTRVHSCAVVLVHTSVPVWPVCTARVVCGVTIRAKPEVLATKTNLT